jgi:hypothetical protein
MAGQRKPPSKLRGLSSVGAETHAKATENRENRAKRWDDSLAPPGYEQDVWQICLMFRDLATRADVYIRAGMPVMYHNVSRTLDWFRVKQGDRAFMARGDGTIDMTYRQVYKYAAPPRGRWQHVVEQAVDEFWTRVWSNDPLADFCDFETFEQMIYAVCDRAYSKHLAAQHNRTPPEPVTWNRDGHRKRRITK